MVLIFLTVNSDIRVGILIVFWLRVWDENRDKRDSDSFLCLNKLVRWSENNGWTLLSLSQFEGLMMTDEEMWWMKLHEDEKILLTASKNYYFRLIIYSRPKTKKKTNRPTCTKKRRERALLISCYELVMNYQDKITNKKSNHTTLQF